MANQTPLQRTLRNVQVDPIFERFLGCIVLGRMANDVVEAIDEFELSEVPSPLAHLVQIWRDCNGAPKDQEGVMEPLQDMLKEMMP